MDKIEIKSEEVEQSPSSLGLIATVAADFGASSPDEVLEIAISLGTSAAELNQFTALTPKLAPGDRKTALVELQKIAGSVHKVNTLLTEAGGGQRAIDALYLIESAREGKLAVRPVEGEVAELSAQERELKGQIVNLGIAQDRLKARVAALESPSFRDLDAAINNISELIGADASYELFQATERLRGQRDAESSITKLELAEFIRAADRIFYDQKRPLELEIEDNTERQVMASEKRSSVEFAVWAEFCEYFSIDSRDLSEPRWGLMRKLKKTFPGDNLTATLKGAISLGKKLGENNINTVIDRAELGDKLWHDEAALAENQDQGAGEDQKPASEEGWDGAAGW